MSIHHWRMSWLIPLLLLQFSIIKRKVGTFVYMLIKNKQYNSLWLSKLRYCSFHAIPRPFSCRQNCFFTTSRFLKSKLHVTIFLILKREKNSVYSIKNIFIVICVSFIIFVGNNHRSFGCYHTTVFHTHTHTQKRTLTTIRKSRSPNYLYEQSYLIFTYINGWKSIIIRYKEEYIWSNELI